MNLKYLGECDKTDLAKMFLVNFKINSSREMYLYCVGRLCVNSKESWGY